MGKQTSQMAFTLVEMVVIIIVIVILVSIGLTKMGLLRTDAQDVANSDALATVQRMQELADIEGLSQTNTDSTLRLRELQAGLAAKGHAHFKMDPANVGKLVSYVLDEQNLIHWQRISAQ
jgi:type II secretory pathway pseudopilin PulG